MEKEIPDNTFKSLCFKELIEYERIDKTPRDTRELLKTMHQACKILEEIGVKYLLSRGTLLGLHRDNKFLPDDLDIDIDVYTDKDVYKIIQKLPYDVLVAATSEGHYMQLAFLDLDTEVVFDIWFYYPFGDHIINRNFFGYFLLPDQSATQPGIISLGEHTYPTFSDPEWYCRYWYGENWRTPKKYGNNWQLDYERDCEAFVFLGERNLIYKKYY